MADMIMNRIGIMIMIRIVKIIRNRGYDYGYNNDYLVGFINGLE